MKRVLLFVLLLLILPGLGCRGGSKAAREALLTPVKLTWWGVFEDGTNYRKVIADYTTIHPNISISYRRFRSEEYEAALVRAFAEGRGPDIFSVHSTWLPKYQSLAQPMPPSVKVVYLEEQGRLKKEIVPVVREESTPSIRQLRDQFVEVVVDDVVRPYQSKPGGSAENRIWALPFFVDTMALYYNRDLLNTAGIAEPPEDWRTFQEDVKALTRINAEGVILQSGAGIGTGENVERSTDLLAAIMMQNGTEMRSRSTGQAAFANVPPGASNQDIPALDALRFYTDFANPLKEVYTWNDKRPSSFEAFANGTSAFFFGYSYHAAQIRGRNPKLDVAVTELPQIEGGRVVNVANYWVETVAKSSKQADAAWSFLAFATGKDHVTSYLESAKRPTALRSLIETQLESETLAPFASQVLTAQSWYRGRDVKSAEEALVDLLEDALTAEDPYAELRIAQNKVNQTL
ncbi:extracellular solute-binding protein [Candidatus Uhrbacteria bacterium]|nr:extracellular solute-binding protein [Candidatus Uhrbacteria bacterium]